MIGELRIWVTLPVNVRPVKASTVKVEVWPSSTLPTSASDTLASICILDRSLAIMNRTGAFMLAATVWPTSTLREMTMPSTGE